MVGGRSSGRSRGVAAQRHGPGAIRSRAPALVPVRVAEARVEVRRGEPVTVLLRSGHMIKVGRDLDDSALARVVALLERD